MPEAAMRTAIPTARMPNCMARLFTFSRRRMKAAAPIPMNPPRDWVETMPETTARRRIPKSQRCRPFVTITALARNGMPMRRQRARSFGSPMRPTKPARLPSMVAVPLILAWSA
jgi:hypothetical protein